MITFAEEFNRVGQGADLRNSYTGHFNDVVVAGASYHGKILTRKEPNHWSATIAIQPSYVSPGGQEKEPVFFIGYGPNEKSALNALEALVIVWEDGQSKESMRGLTTEEIMNIVISVNQTLQTEFVEMFGEPSSHHIRIPFVSPRAVTLVLLFAREALSAG